MDSQTDIFVNKYYNKQFFFVYCEPVTVENAILGPLYTN